MKWYLERATSENGAKFSTETHDCINEICTWAGVFGNVIHILELQLIWNPGCNNREFVLVSSRTDNSNQCMQSILSTYWLYLI